MSFYLINKEKDVTSNDVVNLVKNKVGAKKAGHSGTLDPFATGLLIVATDGDTRFLDRFLLMEKTYTGEITFGIQTDTLDPEGKVISKVDDPIEINPQKLEKVINEKFTGKIKQIPPQYSAIKVKGKKAYELARQGKTTELKPVERIIYSFKIISIDSPRVKFEVSVSSGTYIRAIARDLGLVLKLPAMLTELERTKVETISLKKAKKINEELIELHRKEILNIPEVKISSAEMKRALEGKVLELSNPIKTTMNEIIIINQSDEVLMNKIGANKFFIKKRIN